MHQIPRRKSLARMLLPGILCLVLLGVLSPATSKAQDMESMVPKDIQEYYCLGEELIIPLNYPAYLEEGSPISYRWVITNRFGQEEATSFLPLQGRPAQLSCTPAEGKHLRLEMQYDLNGRPFIDKSGEIGLQLAHALQLPPDIHLNKPFKARLIIDYPHGGVVSFKLDVGNNPDTEIIRQVSSPDQWNITNLSGDWCGVEGHASAPLQRLVLDFTILLKGEGVLFVDGQLFDHQGGDGDFNLLYNLSPIE